MAARRVWMLLMAVALCALLLVGTVSVRAAGVLQTPEEFRQRRLQNLAETIAELQAEAAEEEREGRTLVELRGREAGASAPTAAPPAPAAPAAPVTPPATPAPAAPAPAVAATPAAPTTPRVAPKFQGVARGDLVALYRFDDPSRPGRGLGGSGRSLKVFGSGVQVVTGQDAKRGHGSLFIAPSPPASAARSFLATDSAGSPIRGLPSGGSSFTLAAWYKVAASSAGAQFGILSYGKQERGQSTQLKATSGGQAVATFFGQDTLTSNNSAEALEHSQWHHAAVVYDSSTRTQTMYLDGRVSSQRVLAAAPNVVAEGAGAAFFLGLSSNAASGASSEQFAGFLDDVAIFRVPLLQDEVRAIARGSFQQYLDLYSLRACTTTVGRRHHGGAFVRGAADEQISIDADKLKYGFPVADHMECSVKCAQTTNCRQAVFTADGGASLVDGSSKRPGRCFLTSVRYATFESDRGAVTTTCRTPSRSLQKISFHMQLSADFEAQTAKRDVRITKEKEAANKHKAARSSSIEPKNKGKGKAKARSTSGAAKAAGEMKRSLKERYELQIAKLQQKVKEQAAALAAAKKAAVQAPVPSSQAQNKKKNAAPQPAVALAALEMRTHNLAEHLAERAEEGDMVAQAEAIRRAADERAEQILQDARNKAQQIRRQSGL